MPRRNNRESAEPLDLTPLDLVADQRRPLNERPSLSREEARRAEHDRMARQRTARIQGGMDWTACLVPNCERWVSTRLVRHHLESLPLCFDHLIAAYSQARNFADDPLMQAAADRYMERQQVNEDAAKAARLACIDGHIYFVQLNDLIKVGWTRSLFDRVKSYGASAVLLATYKAVFVPLAALGAGWGQLTVQVGLVVAGRLPASVLRPAGAHPTRCATCHADDVDHTQASSRREATPLTDLPTAAAHTPP